MTADRFEKMRMELRRGALVLAVLAELHEEHYGYSLRQRLEKAGLSIDEGTLYPLIRRLESQGLLISEWRESEGRRRRFYQISQSGQEIYAQLKDEWHKLNQAINPLL